MSMPSDVATGAHDTSTRCPCAANSGSSCAVSAVNSVSPSWRSAALKRSWCARSRSTLSHTYAACSCAVSSGVHSTRRRELSCGCAPMRSAKDSRISGGSGTTMVRYAGGTSFKKRWYSEMTKRLLAEATPSGDALGSEAVPRRRRTSLPAGRGRFVDALCDSLPELSSPSSPSSPSPPSSPPSSPSNSSGSASPPAAPAAAAASSSTSSSVGIAASSSSRSISESTPTLSPATARNSRTRRPVSGSNRVTRAGADQSNTHATAANPSSSVNAAASGAAAAKRLRPEPLAPPALAPRCGFFDAGEAAAAAAAAAAVEADGKIDDALGATAAEAACRPARRVAATSPPTVVSGAPEAAATASCSHAVDAGSRPPRLKSCLAAAILLDDAAVLPSMVAGGLLLPRAPRGGALRAGTASAPLGAPASTPATSAASFGASAAAGADAAIDAAPAAAAGAAAAGAAAGRAPPAPPRESSSSRGALPSWLSSKRARHSHSRGAASPLGGTATTASSRVTSPSRARSSRSTRMKYGVTYVKYACSARSGMPTGPLQAEAGSGTWGGEARARRREGQRAGAG